MIYKGTPPASGGCGVSAGERAWGGLEHLGLHYSSIHPITNMMIAGTVHLLKVVIVNLRVVTSL